MRKKVRGNAIPSKRRPRYSDFKIPKFRYHIMGIRLVDKTDFYERVKQTAQLLGQAISQEGLDQMEMESKFFVVHLRIHDPRGVSFEKDIKIPFDLGKDELGVYAKVQDLVSSFAKIIPPKG